MNSENTRGPACSACEQPDEVLDHLVDALDKLGVEYTIQPAA
ncbi:MULTISPECIES: hypothetical protein [Mycobacteroides]|nr:hypothetical protein [Mycobacteroides abscessus]SIA11101.1 Uncharacterised protein [Mycobacteroides abscessus subsp. abscessus]